MLVCGIDIGTTNLKVALVDGAGRPAWVRVIPTPRTSDRLGPVTDGQSLVGAIEAMVLEGWREVGKGAPLAAFATTGVGEDGFCIDESLTPLTPAIPWFDRRAVAEGARLAAGPAATPRAGIAMDHTRPGAKWLWLREHALQTPSSTRCWTALTDYPLVSWGADPFISETLASRTGCYDVAARAWIEPLLEACGAPPLPPVVAAGDRVGAVARGPLLASGAATSATILVAGGHDHPVAAAAIHRIDPAARVDSIGTANVVYGEAPTFVPDRLDPFVAFTTPIEGGAGIACLGVFEFSSALAAGGQTADVRALLARPRLPGAPSAAEPISGGAASGRGIRSVLEAATMTARRMFETMGAAGVPAAPLYATGGWSRSRGLLELRASVLGTPVRAVREPELTVVGAALFAAEACGASMAFRPEVETVDPDPEWAAAYEGDYPRFRRLLDAAAPGRAAPDETS